MIGLKEVHPYKGVRCFVRMTGDGFWTNFWTSFFSDVDAAMLFGYMIFKDEAVYQREEIKQHEYCHALQHRSTWFFHLRYHLATRRHGYWQNPYEVEARRYSGEAG